MKELIESGEYFRQARIWYNSLYVLPYTLRSLVIVIFCIVTTLITLLAFNIKMLFPLSRQIIYTINVDDKTNLAAEIIKADSYKDDTIKSIAKIFIQTYINIREGYKYQGLSQRMLYIRNTSTKALYDNYASYLSLDNKDSPVLKLQRDAIKEIEIKNISFISDDNAKVKFNAKSIKNNGDIVADNDYEAELSFILDEVNINASHNTPFNFTVSDYKTKLIKKKND